ncbi:hypothetical protein Pla22_35050 [Rubripirellula amarantea]|uniref:DUF983 domain-containing protein n=1 Tax=Rubripirellula amarantea TaxID=2527999 RepID=A0A5C5WLV3_9BACT|nr:hypothetical protein [Rubripirellula amarantea]TWT50762.1 hypothetical protein Pla22_35050 [Rubripirellula amarantea]
MNPYSPPSSAGRNTLHDCPVCGSQVGFIRYAFPLGHCQTCGNYLTIRNWNRKSWIWLCAGCVMLVVPIFARGMGWIAFTPPVGFMVIGFVVAVILNDRIFGRLVPAVCWGWFALHDDDRLASTSNDT